MKQRSDEQGWESGDPASRFVRWAVLAKVLRNGAVAAQVEYFALLWKGEKDEEMWKVGAGYATFADALRKIDGPTHARYEAFKQAVREFGWDEVRANGIDPMRRLLAVPEDAYTILDPEINARSAILADYRAHRDANGTAPSALAACRKIARHYYVPPHPDIKADPDVKAEGINTRGADHRRDQTERNATPDPEHGGRAAVLESEVVRLRARNQELKERVAELEVELADARQKLARAAKRHARVGDRSIT